MAVIAQVEFPFEGRRTVRARFDAEPISSDGGALMLSGIDDALGLTASMADAIRDERDSRYIQHPVHELIRQRVVCIGHGYEDCNDARTLRFDPVIKTACGRDPASGPLASQPSLSRLENSVGAFTCYRIAEALLESYFKRHPKPPKKLILDVDDTADPTHGQQQLSFFNAFYDTYLYLPLLVFDGNGDLLAAVLMPGKRKPGKTIASILRRIIRRIRAHWPKVELLVRADSQFASSAMLRMCRELETHFILGLQPNSVLKKKGAKLAAEAQAHHERTGEKARLFTSMWHRAEKARPRWPRSYRLVVKAEHTALGSNVRFVITDLHGPAADLYEHYVQRGEACENSIKDLKNVLKADRLSCSAFWANQFRLLLHAAAYVLMFQLRRAASGTELANAQMDTLRLRLLKVAARVQSTVRHVWLHLTSAHPWQQLWCLIGERIARRSWLLLPNA